MMAASVSEELSLVNEELLLIETQLEELLERQSKLLKKQKHLQEALQQEASQAQIDANQYENENFSWSKELKSLQKPVFNIDVLRPLQLQTMNITLSCKDCILIMPTGGGKSLCFQLPALVSKGVTLVICPLVSLMEDQIFALRNRNVSAKLLNSSSSNEEVKAVHHAMASSKPGFSLLYVTPEKLAKSKRFMSYLEKMYANKNLARIVVDEVHCCSQWGHDFRPDYKFLGILKRQFPNAPILGLTATASSGVLKDVMKILHIPHAIVLKSSFNRPNLFYEVIAKSPSPKEVLAEIAYIIKQRFSKQSGIIYCLSQKESETLAADLKSHNIQAAPYHAGMDAKMRSMVHERWMKNTVQVVIATIAFGMGIDKPDVRFVIHHSISKSMENYYQESGRAGRDNQPAYCILFRGFNDMFRQSTMIISEETGTEKLYSMLEYANNFSICRRTLIAKHFEKSWNSADCNRMCDLCRKQGDVVEIQSTAYVSSLIDVIQNAPKGKRLTGLQLLEGFMKSVIKCKPSKQKTINGKIRSRSQAEVLITMLIVKGYLKEEYHFTPYTTISYVTAGPMSAFLKDQTHEILIVIPNDFQNAKKDSKCSTSNGHEVTPHFVQSTASSHKAKEEAKPSIQRLKRKVKVLSSSDDSDDDLSIVKVSKSQKKVSKKEIKLDSDDSDEVVCA